MSNHRSSPSAEQLSIELEELYTMRQKVQKAQLQAHIARIHQQIKLAKMIDGVYQEAQLEQKHDIHPRLQKANSEGSLGKFFELQHLNKVREENQHGSRQVFHHETVESRQHLRDEIRAYSRRR